MTKAVYLNDQDFTIVNDIDYDYMSKYKWVLRDGYVIRKLGTTTVSLHREIILRMGLVIPDKHVVDHSNRDRLDNRRCNLRVVTYSVNNSNKYKYCNNSSGFTGVSYNTESKKYHTYINVKGKTISLGCFEDIEDAKHVRLAAERFFLDKE
jgi:hypothetical protein